MTSLSELLRKLTTRFFSSASAEKRYCFRSVFFPVSTDDIKEVRKKGVPKKTAAQTIWATNVWREWAKHRLTKPVLYDENDIELCEEFVSMHIY